MTDYSMTGKTYRYFQGRPLYPFGYGLSYTEFQYLNMTVIPKIRIGDDQYLQGYVQNTGTLDAYEVLSDIMFITSKDLVIYATGYNAQSWLLSSLTCSHIV